MSPTSHVVMHPVQHDFWGTIPTSGHIASHLVISVSRQAKVQNLGGVRFKKAALLLKRSKLNNDFEIKIGL